MSNSLNFLNKPATPAKPIGPQPRPSTAPKAFIDKANPWAVGGGTPTASSRVPRPRAQTPATPARPTPAPVASSARAPAQPAARSTPEPRQAAPAPARATPQPVPVPPPIQMVAPRPTPQPAPTRVNIPSTGYNYTDAPPAGMRQMQAAPTSVVDRANAAQAGAMMPSGQYDQQQQYLANQAAAAQRPKSLEQRAAEAWIRFVSSPTPEAARAAANQAQPGQQPQSPLATPQQRTAAPAGASTAYQLDAPPTVAATVPTPPTPPAPGTPPAPTPAAPTATGTNVPTATGQPLFYGYTAPGPLVIDRREQFKPQQQGGQMEPWMTDRPLYTGYGQRAMLSDAQLATEYTQRQRDAAGSQANLASAYRPWSALTDAEKYQRRFGVMPQGGQMRTDNASGVAAQAASAAQRERLIGEYWQKYAPILGWVDPPLWQYEGAPRTGTSPIQRDPSGARTAAAPARAATQATVLQEAQALAKLYLGGLDTTDFELQDIVAILSRFNPPPDLQQQFSADMTRLAARIPND